MATISSTQVVTKLYPCKHRKKNFNHPGNRSRDQTTCKKNSIEPPAPKERTMYIYTKNWCNREFERKLNRECHSLICKYKEGLKTCFICKQSFSRSTHLRRHLETHSSGKTKKIKCPNCQSTFRHQDKFLMHLAVCQPVSMVNNPSIPHSNNLNADNYLNPYPGVASISEFYDADFSVIPNDHVADYSPHVWVDTHG